MHVHAHVHVMYVSPYLPVSRPISPRSCKNLSTRRERTEESLRISAESCMLSREMLSGTSSESTTCSVNTPTSGREYGVAQSIHSSCGIRGL